MGFGSLITGLAIYKPTQAHWLTSILGGYETARWLHFWLTLGYCGFFLIHIGQVIKAGWNNFRAMVSGYEIVPKDAPPYAAAGQPISTSAPSTGATETEVKQASRIRTRRSLLVTGTAVLAGIGFYKWLASSALSGRQQLPLRQALQANAAVSRAVFDERGLAPRYAPERAVADLRFNGIFGIREELNLETWRLQLVGLADPQRFSQYSSDVTQWEYKYARNAGDAPFESDNSKGPLKANVLGRKRGSEEAGESASGIQSGSPGLLLTMADIRAFAHVEEITEFKCIEGWSEIVRWGGIRLADLIKAYPPALTPEGRTPRYVYMETPNGDYYCGYDMDTCTHPQSLLVYEMSGRPISRWHGAPLRLHMPIKYGHKQIKRIGLIAYTDLRPDDYWTKLGYDWYGGL
jgi:DMSO/TMAO reductase YedYZ molybdopterin-dependent catalytic subunit